MTFQKITYLLTTILIVLIGLYFYVTSYKEIIINKPIIVCTTTIIADAVKNITQKTPVEIKTLMGPGVDPHTYKPIENDVITIAHADIIFYNGLHLEARMTEIFEHMQRSVITIAITKDIPKELLIFSQEFENYPDPHIWFDPTLWIRSVQTITTSLIKKFPEYANVYEKNKHEYIAKIKKMYENTYHEMLTIPRQKRYLITGHDAFSYFAKAYNCNVISLQGISTASEAGTGDVQNVIQIIIKHQINTIFAERGIPTRNMQALIEGSQAYGFKVNLGKELYADSLGTFESSAASYLDMISSNVQNIIDGLQ